MSLEKGPNGFFPDTGNIEHNEVDIGENGDKKAESILTIEQQNSIYEQALSLNQIKIYNPASMGSEGGLQLDTEKTIAARKDFIAQRRLNPEEKFYRNRHITTDENGLPVFIAKSFNSEPGMEKAEQ